MNLLPPGCCLIPKSGLQKAVNETNVIGLAFIINQPKSHRSVQLVTNKIFYSANKKLRADPFNSGTQEGIILDWSKSPGNCSDYLYEHFSEFFKMEDDQPFVALISNTDFNMLCQIAHDKICLASFQANFEDRFRRNGIFEADLSLVLSPYATPITPKNPSKKNTLRGFPFYYFAQACPRRWTENPAGEYETKGFHFGSQEVINFSPEEITSSFNELDEFYSMIKEVNGWN